MLERIIDNGNKVTKKYLQMYKIFLNDDWVEISHFHLFSLFTSTDKDEKKLNDLMDINLISNKETIINKWIVSTVELG